MNNSLLCGQLACGFDTPLWARPGLHFSSSCAAPPATKKEKAPCPGRGTEWRFQWALAKECLGIFPRATFALSAPRAFHRGRMFALVAGVDGEEGLRCPVSDCSDFRETAPPVSNRTAIAVSGASILKAYFLLSGPLAAQDRKQVGEGAG